MPIQTAPSLREGVIREYRSAYAGTLKKSDARLGMFVDLGAFSDGRTNTRAYRESAPHPVHRPYGEPINDEVMTTKSFTMEVYEYAGRVSWLEADRLHDRLGSIDADARGAGENHALVNERLAFDLLLGTTSLLPAVPNAADGTALFSSSTRFGATNGNDLTVSNWNASGPAARGAIWTGLQQFGLYQDTKGQPLFPTSFLNNEVVIIHAIEDMDAVAEALHVGTVGYAASTSNAGVDNVLVTGGRKFVGYPSQRMTAGTMIMAITGTPVKPLLIAPNTPVVESYADRSNSDLTRTVGTEYVQFQQMLAAGIGVVYSILRIEAS